MYKVIPLVAIKIKITIGRINSLENQISLAALILSVNSKLTLNEHLGVLPLELSTKWLMFSTMAKTRVSHKNTQLQNVYQLDSW